jgi:hypothetical protein
MPPRGWTPHREHQPYNRLAFCIQPTTESRLQVCSAEKLVIYSSFVEGKYSKMAAAWSLLSYRLSSFQLNPLLSPYHK